MPKGQSYPVEYCLESLEEYSEGRVHKSEPDNPLPEKRNLLQKPKLELPLHPVGKQGYKMLTPGWNNVRSRE